MWDQCATIALRRFWRIVFFGSVLIFGCGAWRPLHSPLRIARNVQTRTFVPSTAATSTHSTTRLEAKKGNAGTGGGADTVVALVHSHHLLDHKPDNLILKGGRHKLRGAACLGRPGMALCMGAPKSIAKFCASLESAMPQKRFKTKVLEQVNVETCCKTFDGFDEVSLGEMRALLASIGEEGEFFALTGIAPEIATGNSREPEGSPKGGGGKPKKKKRKRK